MCLWFQKLGNYGVQTSREKSHKWCERYCASGTVGPYVSDTTLEGTGDDREALQANGRERGIRSSMRDICDNVVRAAVPAREQGDLYRLRWMDPLEPTCMGL